MYEKSARAQKFFTDDQLDIDRFSQSWRDCGSLPALPSKSDNRRLWDLDDYVKALIETVETQAVHIHKLHERLKVIESDEGN